MQYDIVVSILNAVWLFLNQPISFLKISNQPIKVLLSSLECGDKFNLKLPESEIMALHIYYENIQNLKKIQQCSKYMLFARILYSQCISLICLVNVFMFCPKWRLPSLGGRRADIVTYITVLSYCYNYCLLYYSWNKMHFNALYGTSCSINANLIQHHYQLLSSRHFRENIEVVS